MAMNTLSPTAFDRVRSMVSDLDTGRVPPEVRHFAMLLLLDTLGVAAAARDMDASTIARETALDLYAARPGGPAARMMFDGREASVAGAAFAAAAQIDNLDAHDGYNPTKGHIGVAVVPALFNFAEGRDISGAEALAALIAGYEIAARAGIALHATVSDYHTSGAWNALGVAAIGARLRGLTPAQLREALGIAEYHGPRSQMMRVIEYPTMVKDGSGWGAFAGVSAAYLAADGFTGATRILDGARGLGAGMSSDADPARLTDRLGTRWATAETSFKFHASCRHTHPAADALLALMRENRLKAEDVAQVTAHVHQGAIDVLGPVTDPQTLHQSKFSMGFVLALIASKGRAGLADFTDAALRDRELRGFHDKVKMVLDPDIDRAYPRRWMGRVTVRTVDCRSFEKKISSPKGDPDNCLSRAELEDKALRLALYAGAATEAEMKQVIARVWRLREEKDVRDFLRAG